MKWKKNQIQIKLTLLLIIGIVGIFSIWLYTNHAFKSLRVTLKEFQYPDQKIKHLNNLYDQINNVDQFLRLYSITNKPAYLQKYNTAIDSVESIFNTYHNYVLNDTFKRQQIDTIQFWWQKKLSENKELLTLNSDKPDIFIIGKIIDDSKDTTLFSTQIKNEKTIRDSLVIIKKIPVTYEQKTGLLYKVKRVFDRKSEDELSIDSANDKNIDIQLFSYTYKKQDTTVTDTLVKVEPLNKVAKASVKNVLQEKMEFDTIVNLKRLAIIEKDFIIRNRISKQIKLILKQEQADAEQNIATIQNISADAVNRIFWIFMFILFACVCLYLLLILDNYRIKQYENQLVREKRNYLNLANNRSQFLSMMAHELRTPLQSIIGFSDLLDKHKKTDSAKSFHYTEIIKKSSLHLLQTVNLLLDRSKIDAGKLELDFITFNLSECIKDVFESLSVHANEKNIIYSLISDIPENVFVYSDSFRLKQVLYNLLNNAIKFTHDGNITLTCRSLKQADNSLRVHFKISDTGIGIPKNKIKDLFEEYNQLDRSKERLFGGTGLGLVITKKILELFSSKLLVQSEEHKGTNFLFDLSFEIRSFTPLEKSVPIKTDSFSILVIDDDQYNLLYLHQLLNRSFHNIYIAGSIEEGLTYINSNPIDVILCDLYIHDKMGTDLLPHIAENTKIIFMSADYEKLNTLKEKHLILPKPFTTEALQNTLNTLSFKKPPHSNDMHLHQQSLEDKIQHLENALKNLDAATVLFYLHQVKTTLGYLNVWDEIKHVQKVESTYTITHSDEELFRNVSELIPVWKKLIQLI